MFSQFGSGGAGSARGVEFDLGGSGFSSFFEELFGGRAAPGASWGFNAGPQAAERPVDQEARISLSIEEAGTGGKREVSLADPESGKRKTLRVTIPKGIRPGQKIRLAGQGGRRRDGRRGDLYLTVDILPHPRFTLQDSDLVTEIRVSPWEAVLGGQATLPTLEGKRVNGFNSRKYSGLIESNMTMPEIKVTTIDKIASVLLSCSWCKKDFMSFR